MVDREELHARWDTEKSAIQGLQATKEQIEETRLEIERAERAAAAEYVRKRERRLWKAVETAENELFEAVGRYLVRDIPRPRKAARRPDATKENR